MEPSVNGVAHDSIQVRGYIAVFGALLVLTLVTVGVSYLNLQETPTVVIALAIAATKASLVAMFFMHLKGERPMVFWPLGLTAVLFVALFAFLLWSEGDHLFGTRFHDAFSVERTAPDAQGGH
jgi:cytochrome c oxidase subunit IV